MSPQVRRFILWRTAKRLREANIPVTALALHQETGITYSLCRPFAEAKEELYGNSPILHLLPVDAFFKERSYDNRRPHLSL